MIEIDGARGEGGGQVVRTALTLSLLTVIPFRMTNIRANRSQGGLRAQHARCVEACAQLGKADVDGAQIGSRELRFCPGQVVVPKTIRFTIGTAGSTALLLQTLLLPIAWFARESTRLELVGGTFNLAAPSFPFLRETWRHHLALMGFEVRLSSSRAGFFPKGGGQLEALIEPGRPRSIELISRGPVRLVRGEAIIANLDLSIAHRMQRRARERLEEMSIEGDIEICSLSSKSSGAGLSLTAEFSDPNVSPHHVLGLGERGKPAERVADEAVEQLAQCLRSDGAVDSHSADQILLPLILADQSSRFTTPVASSHLKTNIETIQAFLNRRVELQESDCSTGTQAVLVEIV